MLCIALKFQILDIDYKALIHWFLRWQYHRTTLIMDCIINTLFIVFKIAIFTSLGIKAMLSFHYFKGAHESSVLTRERNCQVEVKEFIILLSVNFLIYKWAEAINACRLPVLITVSGRFVSNFVILFVTFSLCLLSQLDACWHTDSCFSEVDKFYSSRGMSIKRSDLINKQTFLVCAGHISPFNLIFENVQGFLQLSWTNR